MEMSMLILTHMKILTKVLLNIYIMPFKAESSVVKAVGWRKYWICLNVKNVVNSLKVKGRYIYIIQKHIIKDMAKCLNVIFVINILQQKHR
jgi:hypothetical protein